MLKNLEIVDNKNKEGDEIDSTIYDDEGDEFEDEEVEGKDLLISLEGEMDEDEDDEFEDEELEEEDDESEEEKPKQSKKQRRE